MKNRIKEKKIVRCDGFMAAIYEKNKNPCLNVLVTR